MKAQQPAPVATEDAPMTGSDLRLAAAIVAAIAAFVLCGPLTAHILARVFA